jgi:hypothetical protein
MGVVVMLAQTHLHHWVNFIGALMAHWRTGKGIF